MSLLVSMVIGYVTDQTEGKIKYYDYIISEKYSDHNIIIVSFLHATLRPVRLCCSAIFFIPFSMSIGNGNSCTSVSQTLAHGNS